MILETEIDGLLYSLDTDEREAMVKRCVDKKRQGKVVIPESFLHQGIVYEVTRIGNFAFLDCRHLSVITIPKSVTSIRSKGFSFCRSLLFITIPEGVTSIGGSAFENCYNLTSITIPTSVTSIGNSAFSGCSSLTYITIPEGVTSIGYDAFRGCSSLTSITIPEGVTNIGSSAFSGCSSLTSITIPEGMTSIGSYAFRGCSSLTSITIPESVTSIGYEAFYGCSSLRKVINFSNLDIQRGRYDNYEVINNATPVGDYGFLTEYGTNYLICYFGTATELSLPENYNGEDYEIAEDAFRGNSTITSIVIPEGVTSIDDAFYGCSSLASIVIPEGVTSIGDVAFYGCNNLKLVINYSDLPLQRGSSSYGYVGYYADRVINVDNFIGDYAFKTKDGVNYLTGYIGDDTELTLPNDYQGENYQIGESAFNNCSSLTSITIPEKLTSIQRYTFSNCSGLKELTLGKGLKKIDEGSFFSSTGLEKITIYATQPPRTDGYIFPDEVYENATLYVPQGSVSKYQVMTGWSGFYNISEIEGGTPDYLTIRQADNGEVGIAVDLGRTYRVRIAASEGWKVHSITFDGVDMTAKLDEDGTFTTPTLNGSAVLNVAYEQEDGSRVTDTLANAIRVSGHEGVITVDGCVEGENIAVYTTDGTAVAEVQATGTNTEITVESHRLYIVRVATKVVKLRM